MADFSTYEAVPAGSPFTPQQATSATGVAAPILNFVGDALEGASKLGQQKAKARQTAVLDEYTGRLNKYSQAVDQGKMTSQQARTRIRADFDAFRANNPGLAPELVKVQKDMLSSTGLGSIVAEGTAVEKGLEDLKKEAAASGFVNPNAPQEKQQEQIDNYQRMKVGQEMIKSAQAQVAATQAEVSLESSQIALRNAQATDQQRVGTSLMASSYTPKFRDDMNSVLEQLSSGQIDQKTAVLTLQQQWNSVNEVVRLTGDRAGAEHLTNLLHPMKMIYENTLAQANGTMDLETVQNQNDKAMALAQAAILTDPDMARMVALQRMLPTSDLVTLATRTNRKVVEHLDNIVNGIGTNVFPAPNDSKATQDFNTATKIVKDNMDAVLKGNVDELTAQDTASAVNGLLESIDNMSKMAKDKKSWNSMLDFIASPNFGKFSEQAAMVNPENAQKALNLIQTEYERELLPAVRREYLAAIQGGQPAAMTMGQGVSFSKPVNVVEAISHKFSGSGVVFQLNGNANTPGLQAKVKELNQRVAPVINRMVRVTSHLEGTRDYKGVYERQYLPALFGAEPINQEATAQAVRTPRPAPAPGTVVDGWEYTGGDPKDKNSWRKSGG